MIFLGCSEKQNSVDFGGIDLYSQSRWSSLSWHMCMCKLCQCVLLSLSLIWWTAQICFMFCSLQLYIITVGCRVDQLKLNSSQAWIGWMLFFTLNHHEFNHRLEEYPGMPLKIDAWKTILSFGMPSFQVLTVSFGFTKHFDSKAKHDILSYSSHGISDRISAQNLWIFEVGPQDFPGMSSPNRRSPDRFRAEYLLPWWAHVCWMFFHETCDPVWRRFFRWLKRTPNR